MQLKIQKSPSYNPKDKGSKRRVSKKPSSKSKDGKKTPRLSTAQKSPRLSTPPNKARLSTNAQRLSSAKPGTSRSGRSKKKDKDIKTSNSKKRSKSPAVKPNMSTKKSNNNNNNKDKSKTNEKTKKKQSNKPRKSKKNKRATSWYDDDDDDDNDNDNDEYYNNEQDSKQQNDNVDLDALSTADTKSVVSSNDIDREGNDDSVDGSGLYNYEFLDLMDRMRRSGANPRIPQIVLVGPRGCSKTSLLEIITGINLPKGRQYPTTCPLEFNIIRSIKQEDGEILCEMYVKWRYDDENLCWYTKDDTDEKDDDDTQLQKFAEIDDISTLNEYIENAQGVINDSNEYTTISPNSIIVNVYANNVEDMRIVDLPGWIHQQSAAKNVDVKRYKLYNEIIDVYMKDNNNIIAFMFDVLSYDNNKKEYDIFESLIKPYYNKFKSSHQCIGIISGLGLIKSEQDLNEKCSWLQDTLKLGININDKDKLSTFIGIHTFNDYHIENGLNAMDLKNEESDLFMNQEPWSYLFDIRNKLGSDSLLHHLGQLIMISIQPELITWREKLDFRLKKLIIEFKKLPPTITSKDSTAAVSQIVHNFVSEIEKHIKREPGYERTVNRIEYKFLKLRKEIMGTRPRLATKGIDSDPQNGIYTMSDLMKLTKITSGFGQKQHNQHHGRGYNDIIHGVRHFLVESVISSRWSQPSSTCLSSIHSIIGTLLDFLSQKHVHQFIHFQNEIRQTMAELLSKLLGSAKKEIETMLFREKYSPIVDITTLKQKVQAYKIRLKSKSSLFSSGNTQLNENIIEILSQSWAYFDIASNRYCDNIVMVIQSTLVRSLHNELQKCFNQSFLTRKPEKLEELLCLDHTQKKRKKQLVQQFKSLTNHRKQINTMIYRNQTLKQLMKRNNNPNNIILNTLAISSSSLTNNNRASLKIPNQLTHADSIENIQSLISDVEQSSKNVLEQIQPLPDEQLSKNNGKGSMNGDEGFEHDGTNMMAMQTSISTGEDGLSGSGAGGPGAKGGDDLVPVDFYSDYIQKKKQLDALVPKLAQINAQLEAQKRELEKSYKQLRKEQEKLQIEKQNLVEQQNHAAQEMEDVQKEYEELEELKDEFDREKEEFLTQRDKVLQHIGAARSRLEDAAHRMIQEREKFEREKALNHISSATDNGTMISLPIQQMSMSQTQSIPMTRMSGGNANTAEQSQQHFVSVQQQQMLKQLESQRLLMKQMRDAMIQQKEDMEEEKKRLTQPDYLKDEWSKLDAEKENVASTLHEIEAMMLEITEAEEESTKEREQLEKMKEEMSKERGELDAKQKKLKEKEEYLNEFNQRLQSESKKLKEEMKVNSSMYKNKVKQLKTKNKLLSSKLKQVATEGSIGSRKDVKSGVTSEQHHLSLNIGDDTQKDLLVSTFTSVDNDFYATDNDDYGSDDFSTDDSYDLDYYQEPGGPGIVEEDEFDVSPSPDIDIVKEEQTQLLPHSTEEVLHIPHDMSEQALLNDNAPNINRRSTPVPAKGKNALFKPMINDKPAFVESPLVSIESKTELFGVDSNKSTSLLINTDKYIKRKSHHQNKAKTIELSSNKKRRGSVKLELLNDDMMKEFDILIAQQTRISDDIQEKLQSTLQLLEKDFKSYMQRNVELLSQKIFCFWIFFFLNF